jgi:hypothetical protein
MTSFAFRLEPAPVPRFAATVLLFHLLAALAPWLARVPAELGAILALAALVGLVQTLSRLPGRHCTLAEVRHDGQRWAVRLFGSRGWLPAELCGDSRACPWLVYIRLRVETRRVGWLLPLGSVPAGDFRRLKARIRLAC